MFNYQIITLREKRELIEEAAQWFHSIWHIPKEAYLACMEEYLSEQTEYGWYLCLDNENIIGGLGVIENDFHVRKDLSPNVCALFVEPMYRSHGIAKALLEQVVNDCKSKDIEPLYLVTDHMNFYERYGWKFLCMVQMEDGSFSRMYKHE